MSTWRNLSKPQRAALRLLVDEGPQKIGVGLHERTFKSLRDLGLAALDAGVDSRAVFWLRHMPCVVTDKGREVVP